MRLPEKTQVTISQAAHEIFGKDVAVKVFGSRLNTHSSGGDIDLLIQSEHHIIESRRKSLQLVARLQIRLGDQPIDVLVIDPKTERQPIHIEALRTGVAI